MDNWKLVIGNRKLEIGNWKLEMEAPLYIFCSLFPIPYSLFPIPYSLFPVPYSLFPIPFFLFPVPYFQFPVPRSPFPVLLLTELIKPKINLNMISKSSDTVSNAIVSIKPRSLDNNNNVSSSLAEPKAIYRNCKSSLSDRLAEPSEMFTGIEVTARRICELSPNFSAGGKEDVSTYSFLTSAKLFFHASRFWCGFIHFHNDLSNVHSKANSFLIGLVCGSNYHFTGKSSIPYSLFPISSYPILNSNESSIQ